jgi:hypothetical protein
MDLTPCNSETEAPRRVAAWPCHHAPVILSLTICDMWDRNPAAQQSPAVAWVCDPF